MAHQAVGIDRLHELVFSPSRGAVLANLMGLRKTVQVEVTWGLNFLLVYQQATSTKLNPMQQPQFDDVNQFKGRKPRLGATFLSAYASGVEP